MAVYVSVDDLKEILAMQGETFSDAAMEIAVKSASDSCDGYKRTSFGYVPGTRYFTARFGATALKIDDLAALDALTVDADSDGAHETTWTLDEHFYLAPANAAEKGQPWTEIRLLPGAIFPLGDRGVKVEGAFGWPSVPANVRQATILIANMLLSSTQGAPMGVLVEAAGDAVAMARAGRIHPTAAGLLDLIPGRQRAGLQSIQLG